MNTINSEQSQIKASFCVGIYSLFEFIDVDDVGYQSETVIRSVCPVFSAEVDN